MRAGGFAGYSQVSGILSSIHKDILNMRAKLISTILLLGATSILALNPDRNYRALPSKYRIIYREVEFKTSDNYKIKGWFFPAQDTSGILNKYARIGYFRFPDSLSKPIRSYKTIDNSRRPTIVICNGDAGNMSYLILYAYQLFTKGFNVFTFDWRGFGKSDDWPIDKDKLCYSEFLLDYDAAIDFLKKQPEVDTTKIGVFGFSTGAYLSFAIATKRNDISAYAGRALLTSFEDVMQLIKKLSPQRDLRAPENYPKELLPINAASRINCPVFLIVGENDDRTPVWMSKKIYQKLKVEKKLWIVPNAAHGGGSGPEFKNFPDFFINLVEFFQKSFYKIYSN